MAAVTLYPSLGTALLYERGTNEFHLDFIQVTQLVPSANLRLSCLRGKFVTVPTFPGIYIWSPQSASCDGGVLNYEQAPKETAFVLAHLARHLLLYVFPSFPQTGLKISRQLEEHVLSSHLPFEITGTLAHPATHEFG